MEADRLAWPMCTRPTAPKLKRGWWSPPSADIRLQWGEKAGCGRCQRTLRDCGGQSRDNQRWLAPYLSEDRAAMVSESAQKELP